ncbi:TPA: ribokinase, partial [Klebsiella pneumoniae]|nr:ribokinase [Klebsiella pneumoniae]
PVDTMGAGDAFITAFICHFLAQPTGNKREAITNSLQKAAAFSAQICLKEGAFGYGTHY